jgi:hypothetical protein
MERCQQLLDRFPFGLQQTLEFLELGIQELLANGWYSVDYDF